jgi:uncharacterized heparinase superfamily protein
MIDLMLKEGMRGVAVTAERSKRSAAAAGVLASRLLGWSLAGQPADRLLIVPQDLRTTDPSFWREILHGQFGLGGSIAFLRGRSPFDIAAPNPTWERELHGFGWLRNMSAAADDNAKNTAQLLAAEWALRFGAGGGVAGEPAVAARRLISWISHAGLLLEGTDRTTYETITTSLSRQISLLAGCWRDAADSYSRLLALIALMFADLSVTGHSRQLKDVEATFAAELSRQILPDGGHVSRNPGLLVELMLDLLPLVQCFTARDRKHPQALLEAVASIMPMLRFLRLGDGMLARFNGMSIPAAAGLGTVLAYDDGAAAPLKEARASGYARLARSQTILLVDVGTPPPLAAAGEAQAGCLSFEMSSGSRLLLVNCGIPGPAGADWYPAARATASHNTLCLAEKSSSKLVTHRRIEGTASGAPIKHPDQVDWHVEEVDGGLALEAYHDGYHRRFGLIHARRLFVSADGRHIEGRDQLDGLRQKVRLRVDLPFAIHFHLHPDASCSLAKEPNAADISLPDGQRWRLKADGAALSIEESSYFAYSAGPRPALQIVLRGATYGECEVNWVIARMLGEQ